MYGKNTIMKIVNREDGMLAVHSVFHTIQGEGPFAGEAAVFVRLHGCSLACSWCDTEFESSATLYTPQDLVRAVEDTHKHSPCSLIVVTGGEPMRQRLAPFAFAVIGAGYRMQVETAGIHWEEGLAPYTHREKNSLSIVCSPKTPVVKEGIARHALAFKYIIDANEQVNPIDGLPQYAVSQRGQPQAGLLYRPPGHFQRRIYVQPLDAGSEEANKRNIARCVFLVKEFGYRMSLQQHKILGVE